MIERRILRNVEVWDVKTKQRVRIDLDVTFDIDLIVRWLAQAAFDNKARKSGVMEGAVEVGWRGTKAEPVEAETA